MESTWICLFVALFAESCASTTAHRCNDFNLRLDPEYADASWGFYNFTNVDFERGCFICVELHAVSKLSRLIVPCPPAGVADITVSWFSFWVDDSVHFGMGELRGQSQNMDCHSKYESANASQFLRGDIRLENSSLTAAAIDEMSKEFNFPTPMPDRLYTIFTNLQFVTPARTACIRNVSYTYLATTSSAEDTNLYPESSAKRPTSAYLATTSSAGDTNLYPESSTERPTSGTGYPTSKPTGDSPLVWIVVIFMSTIIVAAFAGGVILGRRRSLCETFRGPIISKDTYRSDTIPNTVVHTNAISDGCYEDVRGSSGYEDPNEVIESRGVKPISATQRAANHRDQPDSNPRALASQMTTVNDGSYEGARYSGGYEIPKHINVRERDVYYANKKIVELHNKAVGNK